MNKNKQRRDNGYRSRDKFTAAATKELDRLEAEIDLQAKCLVPARIVITQDSVAKAIKRNRTTFRAGYHVKLRTRIANLRKRAKDPKGVHIQITAKANVRKVLKGESESSRPRIDALQATNRLLANENRMLRRELYLKKNDKSEAWEAFW
jgi:hypothetical protein